MKSYFALTPEALAELYVDSKGGQEFLPVTAATLIEDIRRYLIRSQLDHRVEDAIEIAQAVLRIAEEIQEQKPIRQPMPTPEAANWANDIMQGTTATDAALQYDIAAGDPRASLAAFLTGS